MTRTASRPRGKLTPECQERLIEAIRAGNYNSVAARYAGIDPSTLRRWLRRGRDAKSGRYRSLYLAVRKAETYAEIRAVAIVQKQMEGNWRAAVSYLERKFPERWGSPAARTQARQSRRGQAVGTNREGEYDDSQLAQIARVLHEVGAIPFRAATPADSAAS